MPPLSPLQTIALVAGVLYGLVGCVLATLWLLRQQKVLELVLFLVEEASALEQVFLV